jgi:predicted GIY-YIG superfamily endonuclease
LRPKGAEIPAPSRKSLISPLDDTTSSPTILLRAKALRRIALCQTAKQDALRSRRAKEGYVGMASDLKRRLSDHNSGKSSHTSKFVPWKLVTYIAFSDEQKARMFELYLKSGSGHAFAKKRLW